MHSLSLHIPFPEYSQKSLTRLYLSYPEEKYSQSSYAISQKEYLNWLNKFITQQTSINNFANIDVLITGGGAYGLQSNVLNECLSLFNDFKITSILETPIKLISHSYLNSLKQEKIASIILPLLTFNKNCRNKLFLKDDISSIKKLTNIISQDFNSKIFFTYGIPGLTDKDFRTDLDQILNFKPKQLIALPYEFSAQLLGMKISKEESKKIKDADYLAKYQNVLEETLDFHGYKRKDIYNFSKKNDFINFRSFKDKKDVSILDKINSYLFNSFYSSKLDLKNFNNTFQKDFKVLFPGLLEILESNSLINISNNIITLSHKGIASAHNFIPEIKCSNIDL